MKINPCIKCGSEARLAELIGYCFVKCTNQDCKYSGIAFLYDEHPETEAEALAVRCWNFANRTEEAE